MLELTTPYGNRYRIDGKTGNIRRMDQPDFVPSGQWRMIGLVPVNASRCTTALADITPEWLASHPLCYKNGNPRYTVMDFDHGTTRIWGNTKYHGVKSLRVLP